MIKYLDAFVVTAEIPDEISLAINITNCPNKCEGCHSPELRQNIGMWLDESILDKLITSNKGITCVCFMGGDSNPSAVEILAKYVHETHKLKTAWYSGKDQLLEGIDLTSFDYIKLGPYIPTLGPLNKVTTNQRLYEYNPLYSDYTIGKGWRDITEKFWKDEIWCRCPKCGNPMYLYTIGGNGVKNFKCTGCDNCITLMV